MIGEKKERAGRREFLTLKKHGRAGRQQHQRRDGAQFAGRSQSVTALAICGVGYLIVILNEGDEGGRMDVQAGVPRRFLCHL